MSQETNTPAGCDPARGISCNCLGTCGLNNVSLDSTLGLLNDLAPTLRAILKDRVYQESCFPAATQILIEQLAPNLRLIIQNEESNLELSFCLGDYLSGIVLDFSKVILTEIERREARGDHE